MLEAGRGLPEREAGGVVHAGQHAVQDPGGECVAGADAVDDATEFDALAHVQRAVAQREHRTQPMVVDAGLRAGGGGDPLQVRERGEGGARGGGETLVRSRIRVAVDAEHQFDVAMVGEGEVGFRQQRVQGAARIARPRRPQLRAVIAVERDTHPCLARRAGRLQRGLRGGRTERGGDPGQVQQAGARQQRGPVVARRRSQRERGAGAVVQDLAGPVAGAHGIFKGQN